MARKKIINKKLRKGRFYLVHDGSISGHPGMIYWKCDNKNLYLVLTTGTTFTKELIKLKHPTDNKITVSYVNKKPFLGKRKDFGSNELTSLSFNKEDKKNILCVISIKEPRCSASISRRDKRLFKKIRKKKRIKY